MTLSRVGEYQAIREMERVYPQFSWSVSHDPMRRAYGIHCNLRYEAVNHVSERAVADDQSFILRAAERMVQDLQRRFCSVSSVSLAHALLRRGYPRVDVGLQASGGYYVDIDDSSMIAGRYHCQNDDELADLILRLVSARRAERDRADLPSSSMPTASSVTEPRKVTL